MAEEIEVELPAVIESDLELATSETFEERLPFVVEYDLEVS